MRKVSIRLPNDLVAAYDAAKGTRSALMRRVLTKAADKGDLDGVSDDLLALASAEAAKDEARLPRKRASFRDRCYQHYRDAWESGVVPPKDAKAMFGSWETEAILYGEEYIRFADAIIEYYTREWKPDANSRPIWPDAETFMLRSHEHNVDVPERMRGLIEEGVDRGFDREQTVRKLSQYHPREMVEAAAEEVY